MIFGMWSNLNTDSPQTSIVRLQLDVNLDEIYIMCTCTKQFGEVHLGMLKLNLTTNIAKSYNEVYRRLARHSPRAEANIVKACNTMQWSHKIS